MFKLLVFDWDGTLMDSEMRIVACVQAAAYDLSLPVPTKEAAKDIIGLGLDTAMEKLFPESDRQERVRVVERYRYHYLFANKVPTPLFSGAREVIETLRSEGYLLAVATGKGRPGLNRVLEESELGPLFHATRCADEARSKPDPDMLLQILDELGIDAHEALMIGDTEYDMNMANNAGAKALGVSYGVHDKQRILDCSPLACLDDVTEIPTWLAHSAVRFI
ncbi:MAG: HAD-IA family hydrolase [Candidatus Polarisedimenticolaceae bacterium]|nr:HAD-IA family hydrolase [Candidatus Polarisedimenticolaceae bacterium]